MIFVSLGTQDKPFNRIIDYILKLKEEIKELEDIEIVFQIGQTKLSEDEKSKIDKINEKQVKLEVKDKEKDKNKNDITVFNMIKPNVMEEYITMSNIVITHAGVGTIMECINKNKEIIVLPRKEEYGEHVNNHQEEIAYEMEKKGLLKKVDTYEQLKNSVIEIIKNNEGKIKKNYISNNEKFNDMLINYLKNI